MSFGPVTLATDKQELFEHAMREANLGLRRAVVERLRTAGTPYQRVLAVVEANFDERFYEPSVAHAWLALCAEVPREPQLARIQAVIHARMHSNLVSALKAMLPREEADRTALLASGLIDGLWLRLGLQSGGIPRDEAIALVRGLIDRQLPAASRDRA